MAERQGISIPWASLIAVAAFVGSTLLVPQAFDVLRPAEKEHPKPTAGAELEIDARLWEDPFGAMRRSETERQAACQRQPAPPGCDARELRDRRDPGRIRDLLANLVEAAQSQGGGTSPKPLVIAVSVPGAPFVGAEEARRRTRYAVLSGLQAGGYMPYNAERMGQLSFDLPGRTALQVPYETLLPSGANERTQPDLLQLLQIRHQRPRVVVLWIDETALPTPKIGALAEVLGSLAPDGPPHAPDIAVIGPSTSDGLELVLGELQKIAESCAGRQPGKPCQDMTPGALTGFRLLAAARLLNASATAPKIYLKSVQNHSIRDTLTRQLAAITGRQSGDVHWQRIVSTDSRMVRQMVAELLRRLPARAPRRVLLVAERDSLYAQAMIEQFGAQLDKTGAGHIELRVVYFFRGLDGATARDSSERAAPTPAKGAATPAAIEWPESRDQLDYLRRLAQSVHDSELLPGGTPIGAIGIVANDVHDKLLVLQAMHQQFHDRLFFTIDMDARFAHPRALPFTRNLIVASGLPLEFPPGLIGPIAPMRDMYQTATFLAAQRALCIAEACDLVDSIVKAMHDSPSIYEIGRTRAVPVDGFDHHWRESGTDRPRARLAAMLLGVLAFVLLVWPSTPAIREMIVALFGRASPHFAGQRLQWPTVVTVTAYLTVLAYAAVLAVEFVQPGRWSLLRMTIIVAGTGVTAFATMTTVLWTRRAQRGERWHRVAPVIRHATLGAAGAAAVVGVVALWPVLTLQSQFASGPCTDCEPVALAEGISVWPSQALFVLTMLVIVFALDRTWQVALRSMAEAHDWLGIGVRQPVAPAWGWDRLPRRLWRRLRSTSLMLWPHCRDGPVQMARVWRQYQLRGRPGARVSRTLLSLAVTLTLAAGVYLLLEGTATLDVPARGQTQRALASASFIAVALVMLPLLMVAVADSTTLAVRFISLVGRERSRYPAAVIARFAAAQGPQLAPLWRTPIAAQPSDRVEGVTPPLARAHSLLDDWIDMQVVTRRTEVVSPLVIWPLVAVAMLLLARSRLFDNWSFTLPVALVGAAYLAWTVGLSVWLKVVCERLRDGALRRMHADLQWLAGAGPEMAKLVEPMKRLIAAVNDERRGAFAGLLEQPLFRGLMVPLGGAGGAQIFDYLLLAH